MLEVGAVNEDMDMPPLESPEGEPDSPGHEGAAQQHTSSGASTEGNGEGLPGWQATAQRTHASSQSDRLDAAHCSESNIGRELRSVLSYISYYGDECVTDNELRIWLNEKLIELSIQILNDKERKIWDQIRITCALEPMHPHRTQESAESSSSSNGSSLKELTDKSDNGCGVEGPDHRTRNKSTPSGERTRIGSGGRQELIGTETSAQPPRPTPKGSCKQVRFANKIQVLVVEKEYMPNSLQEGLVTKIAPGDALELQNHRLQTQGKGQKCSVVKTNKNIFLVGDSEIRSDEDPND